MWYGRSLRLNSRSVQAYSVSDPYSFIDQCYAAVLEPDRWPAVLNALSEITGAYGCGLVSHDASRTGSTLHSDSLKVADNDFKTYWWQHDTRIHRSKKLVFQNGDIATDFGVVSERDKSLDPFFQEFCKPYKMEEIAAYFAKDPLGGMMTVSIFRGSNKSAFDSEELRARKNDAPPLPRAYQPSMATSDVLEGLSSTNVGAILLDDRGYVRQANEAALRMSKGLFAMILGAPIRLNVIAGGKQLDNAIREALPYSYQPRSGSAVVSASLGEPTHIFTTLPVKSADSFLQRIGVRTGGVLVSFRELKAETGRSVKANLRDIGLTPAEANVAELVGMGHSPREVAELGGVSEATVRVQLRSIYHKLSIRRQSELALYISRLRINL